MYKLTVGDAVRLLSSRAVVIEDLSQAFIGCWAGIICWQSVITGDETIKLTRDFAPIGYTRDQLVMQISKEIGLDPNDTENPLLQSFLAILHDYIDQYLVVTFEPVGVIKRDGQGEYEVQVKRS